VTLNYVTLTLNLFDGSGTPIQQGSALLTPSAQLTDSVDHQDITQAPVSAWFRPGIATSPQVTLLATDNGNVLPAGWAWTITFENVPGNPQPFNFFLPFTSGATQLLSSQTPVFPVTTMQAYMPLSGGVFTGAVSPAEAGLADGATIPLNAAGGNLFRVTLAGNRTLANPSGGTDGQLIRVEVTQDSTGSRTLAYGSAYDFGASGVPVLSTAPNATDVLGFSYEAGSGKWFCLAISQGY
jgi:hypothetical protein